MLCDNKISAGVKGKLYKIFLSPTLLYRVETWPLENVLEAKLDI